MSTENRLTEWDQVREDGRERDAGLEGPLLFFGNVAFDSAWQRCQQFAICLARSADVVYIDPNRSFLQVLRRRPNWAQADRPARPRRLVHYRPCPGLPFARAWGVLNRVNYCRTLAGLRRFLAAHNLAAPSAVVMTYPDQAECLDAFAGVPLIYDLMDEPTLFVKPRQRERCARLHGELLARAQALITSSRVLLRRYGSQAVRAAYVSNGVSGRLLAELSVVSPEPRLSRLPGPRFGYVGTISHWFDFEAVRALARSNPTATVILVGPVECKVPRLPENVVLTGPVPHWRLAPVLRTFDVGLIPFLPSPGIDAVNPVKLYEYLAAGLPVLAAKFEELHHFTRFVTLYRGADDCAAAAKTLLGQRPTAKDVAARREFARCHCWSNLAGEFLGVIRRARYEALAPAASCRRAG